ncbi:MAG: hypothetical protein ARM1_0766 [Candidatus Micrarchaeota archaeon]|nr:MAG: hypothetical protein ARM1_0766 [Candidatus Micrarchaeota archaeon]
MQDSSHRIEDIDTDIIILLARYGYADILKLILEDLSQKQIDIREHLDNSLIAAAIKDRGEVIKTLLRSFYFSKDALDKAIISAASRYSTNSIRLIEDYARSNGIALDKESMKKELSKFIK